jgi:hypothetical protein
MDGWMDGVVGWMDGWVGAWVVGWMDGFVEYAMNGTFVNLLFTFESCRNVNSELPIAKHK